MAVKLKSQMFSRTNTVSLPIKGVCLAEGGVGIGFSQGFQFDRCSIEEGGE